MKRKTQLTTKGRRIVKVKGDGQSIYDIEIYAAPPTLETILKEFPEFKRAISYAYQNI